MIEFDLEVFMSEYASKEWLKDFDFSQDSFVTALILAIKYGDWDSAASLIPKLPSVNSRDDEKDWTPLMHAAHEGSLRIVQLLVEAGADINLKGNIEPDEDFALNLAAYANNKEIFQYLAPLTRCDLRSIAEQTLSHHGV